MEGLYAIIPTPAKPTTPQLDVRETVDLDETERLVQRLLQDGVHGLIILGTTGECATLARPDYDAFAACVLQTVAGRVPVIVGTTALGMHEVADRMRFVRDLGAAGTLLGLPMWQPLTVDMAVSFYARLSASFPDLPIMAYANKRAFRFDFPVDFWRRVAQEAPTVTSAKHSKPATVAEFAEVSDGRIQFVPHQSAVLRFAELLPDATRACWSTAASLGPEPALAIIEAILAGDLQRAAEVDVDLRHAVEPVQFITKDPEVFASFTIQIEKTRMQAGDYCTPGPIRPPYDVLPVEFAEAAAESARRWMDLRPKYAARQLVPPGRPESADRVPETVPDR